MFEDQSTRILEKEFVFSRKEELPKKVKAKLVSDCFSSQSEVNYVLRVLMKTHPDMSSSNVYGPCKRCLPAMCCSATCNLVNSYPSEHWSTMLASMYCVVTVETLLKVLWFLEFFCFIYQKVIWISSFLNVVQPAILVLFFEIFCQGFITTMCLF